MEWGVVKGSQFFYFNLYLKSYALHKKLNIHRETKAFHAEVKKMIHNTNSRNQAPPDEKLLN